MYRISIPLCATMFNAQSIDHSCQLAEHVDPHVQGGIFNLTRFQKTEGCNTVAVSPLMFVDQNWQFKPFPLQSLKILRFIWVHIDVYAFTAIQQEIKRVSIKSIQFKICLQLNQEPHLHPSPKANNTHFYQRCSTNPHWRNIASLRDQQRRSQWEKHLGPGDLLVLGCEKMEYSMMIWNDAMEVLGWNSWIVL